MKGKETRRPLSSVCQLDAGDSMRQDPQLRGPRNGRLVLRRSLAAGGPGWTQLLTNVRTLSKGVVM